MKIIIDIETDNAAFEDDRQAEIERILREWLDKGGINRRVSLRDYNGNTVGRVTIEDDEPEPDDDSDGARTCPDCDRPNQFGQVCERCQRDRDDDARPTVDFHE